MKKIEKEASERDWRKDYIICTHLQDNRDLRAQQSGFRACCMQCHKDGFLYKSLAYIERRNIGDGKLDVAMIKEYNRKKS